MAASGNSSRQAFFWLALISTLGAVATHLYLMDHHYQIKFGLEMADSVCDIDERFSCSVASASKYSEFFGLVPMAVLGVILNGIIALLLIAYRWPIVAMVSSQTIEKFPGVLKLTSLGVFATSIVMGAISISMLKTVCLFCSLTYLLSALTLVGLWVYLGGKSFLNQTAIAGTAIVGVATIALGLAFHQSNMIKYGGKDLMAFVNAQFLDWQNQNPQEIQTVQPMVYNDKAKAKMKLVEFADYLCPHCKHAYPKLKLFLKSRPDVSLEFQAFPLDGTCNQDLPKGDGARCLLARFSYCSQKQDKGWDAQKWIFDNQKALISVTAATEKLKEAKTTLGLDDEKMKACIESEEAHQTIKDQAALGQKLNIRGTPSLFINGRKVQAITLPVLEKIYNQITEAK